MNKKWILRLAMILCMICTVIGVNGCTSAGNKTYTTVESKNETVKSENTDKLDPDLEEIQKQEESDNVIVSQTSVNVQSSNENIGLSNIPKYSGQAYIVINSNNPFFSDADKVRKDAFESYSDLDSLGRCQVAYANICKEIMPTEERGKIGSIKPSGWHTVKYDTVDGKYLYNRCHLIGFQLAGENANAKNLITGTRYLNVTGMLPFENMVSDYVKETNNHVLYRVTPIFEKNNLIASGVLIEGYSVEDKGEGITFCVYCYNVQPGINIDYATGDSSISNEQPQVQTTKPQTTQPQTQMQPQTQPQTQTQTTQPQTQPHNESTREYIINTNTNKFHYTNCRSVKQMAEKNKLYYEGTRDEVIAMGYSPCKNCNP